MKWRTLTILIGLVVVGLVVAVVSCTPHRAYRVPNNSIRTSIEKIRDDAAHRVEVESHCVEEHSEFSLGFVEFDDQGDLWEPEQVDRVETLIREEVGEDSGGALIVVFVHGWKHDATVCDENVACFREILKGLDNMERFQAYESKGESPRRVVGVYLGWRGRSVKPPVLKEFSFYSRKATAHRVGNGRVVEVLTRLENLRDELNANGGNSRLVVVGHSFGGAVTYTALASIFEERLARGLADDSSVIKGFGDLVVLVNPAFEASLYSGVREQAMARSTYLPDQPAVLLVVTSESDTATKTAFPLGRKFSTAFSRTRDREQKRALRTAVGHYLPYRTHFIREVDARSSYLPDLNETEDGARGASDCVCSYIDVESLTSSDYAMAAGIERSGYAGAKMEVVDESSPDFNPFPMAGTTDVVVSKHNGIYNRTFIDFLRTYLLEMDERREQVEERGLEEPVEAELEGAEQLGLVGESER